MTVTEAQPEPAGLAELHPANFAMVMATGIISIAAWLLGWQPLAWLLFGLNWVFYIVLWALTAGRFVRHRDRILQDLMSHGRGVGFFTMVAGTCVLGSQCILVAASPRLATVLWVWGIALWAALTYTIFTALTVRSAKPGLAEGIHGGWLVAVVATQSVAVLGTQVAPALGTNEAPALFFSLAMWLGGGMLYIWIIALVFYRYMFFPLSPSDLNPPYWINMGAMAISTLAGALLIRAADHSTFLLSLLPFLKGLTLLFWATATWWIPLLVILGTWRHVYRRFPIRYDPLYWGAVFPLGMYTVCTLRLAAVLDTHFLLWIPNVFIFIALAAWIAVFYGLLRRLTAGAAARLTTIRAVRQR